MPTRLHRVSRIPPYSTKRDKCFYCNMKHTPTCEEGLNLCRNCGCGKEWHPFDGPCRVGPETEFTLHNCHCQGYAPKDNLIYLEYLLKKLDNNDSKIL